MFYSIFHLRWVELINPRVRTADFVLTWTENVTRGLILADRGACVAVKSQ